MNKPNVHHENYLLISHNCILQPEDSTIQNLEAFLWVCDTASDTGVFQLVLHPFIAASTLIRVTVFKLPMI